MTHCLCHFLRVCQSGGYDIDRWGGELMQVVLAACWPKPQEAEEWWGLAGR